MTAPSPGGVQRPPRGGWAPGNYMVRCVTCKRMVMDADKRAYSCADCAYAVPDQVPLVKPQGVQRYSMYIDKTGVHGLHLVVESDKNPDGDWVRYGDIAGMEKELAELRHRFDHHRDWNQQRYNALRKWVDAEVRPLSEEVYCRYYNIVANGAPSPHEGADWNGTLHSATLARDVAVARMEQAGKEVARLRKVLEDAQRLLIAGHANVASHDSWQRQCLVSVSEALRGAAGEGSQ